jgi:hypothetical protein
MKKSQFTESQIVAILKEGEAGAALFIRVRQSKPPSQLSSHSRAFATPLKSAYSPCYEPGGRRSEPPSSANQNRWIY